MVGFKDGGRGRGKEGDERELSEKGLSMSASYVRRWVETIGIILVPVCLQVYLELCDPIHNLGGAMLMPSRKLFSLCFPVLSVVLCLCLEALRCFPCVYNRVILRTGLLGLALLASVQDS